MIEGFKAYEKHFKKFETSEAAVKEGKAIDFNSNAGYTHVCDIKFDGKMSRLLSFDGFEGSYVITSALSRQLQVELVQHCLSDCLQPENKTNLHGHTESAVISSVGICNAALVDKARISYIAAQCLHNLIKIVLILLSQLSPKPLESHVP